LLNNGILDVGMLGDLGVLALRIVDEPK